MKPSAAGLILALLAFALSVPLGAAESVLASAQKLAPAENFPRFIDGTSIAEVRLER
ncbi:MAG: hypothetical protein ACKPB0_00675 [Opitutaceae bacterium]